MTSLYQVGPDELFVENCNRFEWVVHWYEIGCYDGNGEAVSFDGKDYRTHDLSHCSCYGPDDGMEDGDIISLDDLFGDSVRPGIELRKEVLDKVRELTAAEAEIITRVADKLGNQK